MDEILKKGFRVDGIRDCIVKAEKEHDGPKDEKFYEIFRKEVIRYCSVNISTHIEKGIESCWSDNFGDTETLDVPVILVDGKPSASSYHIRRDAMKFCLENIELNYNQKMRITEYLNRIQRYEDNYRRMIGD